MNDCSTVVVLIDLWAQYKYTYIRHLSIAFADSSCRRLLSARFLRLGEPQPGVHIHAGDDPPTCVLRGSSEANCPQNPNSLDVLAPSVTRDPRFDFFLRWVLSNLRSPGRVGGPAGGPSGGREGRPDARTPTGIIPPVKTSHVDISLL